MTDLFRYGVKSVTFAVCRSLPVYTYKQTC
jgi:hypothetical protein